MQGGILLKEFCTSRGMILCFPHVLAGGLVIFRENKITSLFLRKGAKDLHREFYHHKVRRR